MPAVHSSITRRPLHRRAFDVEMSARTDGWFGIEARLGNHKCHEASLAGVSGKVSHPIHDMHLHRTAVATLTLKSALSETRWISSSPACRKQGETHAQLSGLNLQMGLRQAIGKRLDGSHASQEGRDTRKRSLGPSGSRRRTGHQRFLTSLTRKTQP
jgi:Protein of unknown function (DUF2889)